MTYLVGSNLKGRILRYILWQICLCNSLGIGCGTVGRVVVSDTRNLQFESSNEQFLFTVSCIVKIEARNGNLKIVRACHSRITYETFVMAVIAAKLLDLQELSLHL